MRLVVAWVAVSVTGWVSPACGAEPLKTGEAQVFLSGDPAPPPSSSVCGFLVVAKEGGPQVALMGRTPSLIMDLCKGEEVALAIPVQGLAAPFKVTVEVALAHGGPAEVGLSVGEDTSRRVLQNGTGRLEVSGRAGGTAPVIRLEARAKSEEAAVRWTGLRVAVGKESLDVPIRPAPRKEDLGPPPVLPALCEPIERALIEWDWRMQDGIGTERSPSTYAAAIERTLRRGDELICDLQATGLPLREEAGQWRKLRRDFDALSAEKATEQPQGEDLWRRAHELRRRIALGNPQARVGPLLFVKQTPACFSHQLTQYYGRYARPGGGVFVLDAPGRSMNCRRLGALPEGSYQHPEVFYDGARVLFSYCKAETTPQNTVQGHPGRYYHLYEMAADGSALRQLTDGPFDDFAPRYLPDGKMIFISTRRLGWHRCGNPGCENYTLTIANPDGSDPRTVSYHETQEWDPAVLDDGRVVYTRWDYVDRHAVFYEQLWSVRPDGSAPAAFYGNNTFNPVGTWEARQVPGSRKVMATAAAHHAMTAGSIILVDPAMGGDGPQPITRLTPDAPFPESEAVLLPRWRATAVPPKAESSPEAVRWPGHCYRSAYPLSEKYFLVAYSFDSLIGEPKGNPANMFGIYLMDSFGNKELLYRDLNIASLWPTPLRPRRRPPVVSPGTREAGGKEGAFIVQNVYTSAPKLSGVRVKRLRIVQVVPKSTPGANRPPVGVPNASPGKQVLGTAPVEADGSAYFRAPAGIPLSFQALDEQGMAVQVMRSVTYLQPGETASCVGCHEPRTVAPPHGPPLQALNRPPSIIEPGPDGSKPLSYPILVQPVLDKRCVSCHSGAKPAGGIALTGNPQGKYSVSYNALAPLVSYSAWGRPGGDFRVVNSEPLSAPGYFGARGSRLLKILCERKMGDRPIAGALDPREMERLVTWMDANALFYGTFDPADQARQQRGERIEGPKLE